MKRIVSLLLCLSTVSLVAAGKDNAQATLALQFAAYGDDLFEGLYYLDKDDDIVEVRFYPHRRSQKHRFPVAQKNLMLFRDVPMDGERWVRTTVATIELDGIEQLGLVVLLSLSAESGGMQTYVFDEDLPDLVPESLRTLNLTGRVLEAKIGSWSSWLPPGVSPAYSLEGNESQSRSLSLTAYDGNGQARLVYSATVSFAQDRDTLLVVLPPQHEDGELVTVYRL